MVEIKITGETAAKAHEEFVALSNLMLGGKPTASLSAEATAPSRSERVAQEAPVKEEETPVVEEEKPKRASRPKKETKQETKAEETPAVEEAKPVEETKSEEAPAAEETKAEEPPAVEETKPTEEAAKYEGDFTDCKNLADVTLVFQRFVTEFHKIPNNSNRSKAKFAEMFADKGARTIRQLSDTQIIDFYNALKKMEAEDQANKGQGA